MKGEILQLVGLLLTSSTKFLFAPSLTTGFGYSYWETVLIFYYFGKVVVELFMRNYFRNKKAKSQFTRTNRFIIKVKNNFGILGLAIITPVMVSIPIGSILAARYFSHVRGVVYVLIAAVVFWAFVLTTISFQFKQVI